MNKKEAIKRWRTKKVTLYVIGAALIIAGVVLVIQSFLTASAMQDAWKAITGFVIALAGLLTMAESWNESFRDYMNKKNR